ncbi:sugar phosphate isomerase/epimerase [Paenibacillus sp. Marseille-Q4541]|uniref:sugar phosphate isomerase/epimerase family protein n=1 Tax=Paenibacillus sp. Marseille-Q4541 TaxID=2831522 RepID=UPI001BA70328|nr:sugar phosphate isomerase/epimerase [Paenibacillus sp. Marseille-Q4541]
MKRGLSKAGLGEVEDILFITKAAEYGFEAVDLDAKGLIDHVGLSEAQSILEQHQISVGAIGLNVEWRKSDEEFQKGLLELASYASAARSLGCKVCCTYILPSTDDKPAAFMARAVKRLRICAEVLGTYGITLALEFVGPHHLRSTWSYPFIWTMNETLEMIDAMGVTNAGLLIDSYHCHTTGLSGAELGQLNSSQIAYVHINDAYDKPVDQLLDNDRLYTGEGVIDLSDFVQSLQAAGYNGVVSQEVLTSALPTESLDQLLEKSKAGFDHVFGKISYTTKN